ncbi:PRA1-like protein [Schizosaccharomyces pombe]|uniref:PRA1-like protein n=1 Tax=Schizosaccharomyces pombe (strain 972 / ATCC 24843) TaxID=284812 RepID=PRA1_SCHPO|nr:putative Rab GTPase-binding protein [Schizosaccharomyces pombe]Q9UUN5.1 RecName: Full=PRA1-like protein [Schizosaccharomyces pombe 972h-]CAB41650.1 Rab GTPase binding involved in ER to Golgi vesicle transport (predicted) [Schizosaccharomyces pombe]|eukprot:NP_587810.1 putative Rab GTPase-binding protein [Schizosaccharomyces pombe]
MSALSLSITKVSETFSEIYASRAQYLSGFKSVGEFLDVRRISRPRNFSEAQSRISFNFSRFSSNYLAIIAMLVIYALIRNPLLLIVIGIGVGGVYGIRKLQGADLQLSHRVISNQNLYVILACVLIPLGLFASPIETIIWLVGASCVCVFGHAAFFEPPVESAFETVEQQV